MNPYLKNLNKIEFVVTYACTGRCKHCSEGDHSSCGESIDPILAAEAVKRIAAAYPIQTVMTFGGEPLLYPDAVYTIMEAAKERNVPKRQVITNGYFSRDVVKQFAAEALRCGIPMRLSPAWLVRVTDDNSYNLETRKILSAFTDMGIPVGDGNVIFPEGNALKYLAEYFTDVFPENPYVEDPRDVRCLSFSPNGDVLGGNVYERDIMEILNDYALGKETP